MELLSGRGKAIKIAIFVAISVLVLFTINSHFQSSGLSLYSWSGSKETREAGGTMKKRGKKFGAKGKKGKGPGKRLKDLPEGNLEDMAKKKEFHGLENSGRKDKVDKMRYDGESVKKEIPENVKDNDKRFNIKDENYKVGKMGKDENIKKIVKAPVGQIAELSTERRNPIQNDETNEDTNELKKKNVQSKSGERVDRMDKTSSELRGNDMAQEKGEEMGKMEEGKPLKEFRQAPVGKIPDQSQYRERRVTEQGADKSTQDETKYNQSGLLKGKGDMNIQDRKSAGLNRATLKKPTLPSDYKPKIVLLCAYMKGGSTFLGKTYMYFRLD